MPENDESRARLMAQRVLEARKANEQGPVEAPGVASEETPDERLRRYQTRSAEASGETPEQRTARYLEKARRAGYLSGTQTSPMNLRNEVGPRSQPDGGERADESSLLGRAVNGLTDWMQKPRANPFPKALQPLAARGEEIMRYRPVDPGIAQDQEIERNSKLIEELERIKREGSTPRDGGEIDGPAPVDPSVRQPIQMERTFSNDQQKEEYLQRIRDAQRNVSK